MGCKNRKNIKLVGGRKEGGFNGRRGEEIG
jgi:hypothetical protein